MKIPMSKIFLDFLKRNLKKKKLELELKYNEDLGTAKMLKRSGNC